MGQVEAHRAISGREEAKEPSEGAEPQRPVPLSHLDCRGSGRAPPYRPWARVSEMWWGMLGMLCTLSPKVRDIGSSRDRRLRSRAGVSLGFRGQAVVWNQL